MDQVVVDVERHPRNRGTIVIHFEERLNVEFGGLDQVEDHVVNNRTNQCGTVLMVEFQFRLTASMSRNEPSMNITEKQQELNEEACLERLHGRPIQASKLNGPAKHLEAKQVLTGRRQHHARVHSQHATRSKAYRRIMMATLTPFQHNIPQRCCRLCAGGVKNRFRNFCIDS
jgi:hypothetical protein